MQQPPHTSHRQSVSIALVFFLVILAAQAAINHEQHRENQREQLRLVALELAQNLEADFDRLLVAFENLDTVSIDCDRNTLDRLREEQFDLTFISELGMSTRDGNLACTSWQKITQNIPVQKPPAPGDVRIFGPINSKFLGKTALVLSQGRSDGTEINALAPLRWLRSSIQRFSYKDGYQAVIHSESGIPLVLEGKYTLPIERRVEFPLNDRVVYEGLMDNGETHYVVVEKLDSWPVALINARRVDAMDAGAWRLRSTNFALALVLSILVYFWVQLIKHKERGLTQQIQQGISNREFVNHYQPIVDARTHQISGLEVLIRWQHPIDGLVPPDMFIPEAERSGLIIPMTSLIIKNAISELKAIYVDHPGLRVNINICGQHLLDERFIEEVVEAKKHIPNLMLELTENEMVAYKDEAIIQAVNALRGADISLAIDDFGTGYSGLQYLGELPIDCIKIDRSFVAACGTDSPSAVVLETVANMASKMRKSTVAEGVETEEQARYLISKQVFLHQGWLYAKAMPAEDLLPYMQQSSRPIEPLATDAD